MIKFFIRGVDLLIGIADDGSVIGVTNPDEVSVQVSNMIRNAISPDITLNTHIIVEFRENKLIVRITVNRGSKRPYYITKKGMTSWGC